MAEEVALTAADLYEAIDPAQQPGGFQRGDGKRHGRARTFRSGGDPLIAREAAPGAVGAVEAPENTLAGESRNACPNSRARTLAGALLLAELAAA